MRYPTLDRLDVAKKRVLLRADLNVPMQRGKVSDATRIARLLPTIRHLMERQARTVILSHFGRPDGQYVTSMSLAPLADALSEALGTYVKFGVDCRGEEARRAVEALAPGEVLLLENLRFHAEEEANDPVFARDLASLGDLYVNDAFSCSHRAHASVVGIAQHLPSAAGRLMEEELSALGSALLKPKRPVVAIVGGSKISTKLLLLEHLVEKVNMLVIGGGMANTFLYAQGVDVGASLCEKDLKDTANRILHHAEKVGCEILLPSDVVVAKQFAPHAPCRVISPDDIQPDEMILDLGPMSVAEIAATIADAKTLLWNGPVGAFEVPPFDNATVSIARIAASLTAEGVLNSVAGGGDTVAVIQHAGLGDQVSYLSTAGGAFLEWLEGKTLPGVAALLEQKKAA